MKPRAALQTRDLLTAALASLIGPGVADNSIRADIRPNDVLMSLGGITLIAGDADQRELAGRLIDLLIDGLVPRTIARPASQRVCGADALDQVRIGQGHG